MTVAIEQNLVYTERLGLIGELDNSSGVYKFRYVGDTWVKLKYDENTAVQGAVIKPLALLNITQRLRG